MKNQMEMSDKRNKYTALLNENSFKLERILESIIVGMLTGLIISFLRFLVDKSGYLLVNTYKTIGLKHWLIPVWIIFLITIGYIIGLIAKRMLQLGEVVFHKLKVYYLKSFI
ncbi:hypothetical protein ACI7YV_11835 [Clostridium ljungdahlii]|uniref:hypothetical protein n=1 Tax=Clostridium ljungdahlii TaxID=1538 RepID=UPI003865BC1B